MNATFEWQTAPGAGGALGAVMIRGEVDLALHAIGVGVLRVGAARVASLCGVDRGVAARITHDSALLVPHAGGATAHALTAGLERAGLIAPRSDGHPLSPLVRFPEAADLVEACLLDALSSAPSPLAVDLLLEHAHRWRSRPTPDVADAQTTRALGRLLSPALVVAVGPANVGKSSLLNAMAGRRIAVVADEPGVTRDHVGATIECDGLVVRWADTPGVRATADPIEREAQRAAEALLDRADLVLSCADSGADFLAMTPRPGVETIRVRTRADLGSARAGRAPADIETSALTGAGLSELAALIRRRLVPDDALACPKAWRFHAALPV